MGNEISINNLSQAWGIDKDLLTVLNYGLEDNYDIWDEEDDSVEEEESKEALHRIRLDWYQHVKKCQHEKSFSWKYRMTHDSFCKLVKLLEPLLHRDPERCSRGDYIIPQLVVAIGIRFLAGEPYTALNDIANISTPSVYRLKNRFIFAVLNTEELKIKLPSSAEEWESVRQGFENISSHGLFKSCVGAIDVFFVQHNSHVLRIQIVTQWHLCQVIITHLG
jgi:hypothetical protein